MTGKSREQPADSTALHRRAEERWREKQKSLVPAVGEQAGAPDSMRIVHELQVHQIELEMQNEELQQARAESEALMARYADLYELAPVGYLTLDREGTISQVNVTGALQLGVARSRLVNQRFALFVAESGRSALAEFLQRVFASESKERCEVLLPGEGSQPRVVQIEATRSADGRECRAVMVDISSLRQKEVLAHADQTELQRLLAVSEQSRRVLLSIAEDARAADDSLRKSEEEFRATFDQAAVGMAQVAIDGRFLRVNQKLLGIVGYARDELLTNTFQEITHPDDLKTDLEHLRRLLSGESTTFTKETRYIRKDASQVWAEVTVSLVRTPAGEPNYFVAVLVDISERKRIEQQLKQLYRQHELILDSAAEGILGMDLQGKHTFVNPAASRMLGYEPEELLGRLSHSLWHHTRTDGSPYPEEACLIYAAGRDGEVHRSSTEVFWRKDGASFPVEYASTPVREQDRLSGVVVTFSDITERLRSEKEKIRLEDQLRQSQKVEAIGSLAGGVAHDFNNITAIILGYGEMLLGRLQPDDPARRWAEQIVEAGRRSAALTRQLLAFSRKQTLQPAVLDLNALLRNLEKMLGRIGENIKLELILAGDLGRVTADPGQIEQVVLNLVVNARDAMPLGGSLRIETANVELEDVHALGHPVVVPGRYVLLTLTDTGSGMDKAILARLFEPFFTTKPVGKGTGLGLATVHGIVKQSGGHIRVASEPGQGTTFKIYLPRTDAVPAANAAAPAGETPRGGGELILLVEDEAPLREMVETVLSGLGYRVSAVGSGEGALALMAKEGLAPDLVLTDVVMPEMSGAELADRLRSERPDLKVLYMSGYPDDAIARHGVLDFGKHFLQKPFSERTLAAKVREVIGGTAPAARCGRRILMIDDDEQFRELVQHFCRRQGHEFAGVNSAAAALEALAAPLFDVLLVDLNLPGTDGAQVLREIRAAGCRTPAIVLTGDVGSADMHTLRPLGAVLALQKSSNAEPLLQAIEAVAATGGAPPVRL